MAGSSADDESRRLREREAALVRHAFADESRTCADQLRRHACVEVPRRRRLWLWKALSLRRCVQVKLWRIAATLLTPPACRMRHPQRMREALLQPHRTSMRGARCVVTAPRFVHVAARRSRAPRPRRCAAACSPAGRRACCTEEGGTVASFQIACFGNPPRTQPFAAGVPLPLTERVRAVRGAMVGARFHGGFRLLAEGAS